jgi:hypothetical protein
MAQRATICRRTLAYRLFLTLCYALVIVPDVV